MNILTSHLSILSLIVLSSLTREVKCKKINVSAATGCGRCLGNSFTFYRKKIEHRIVAGYDVGYYKYPWYASLISPKFKNFVACGGTLIGPSIVLSAAHCFISDIHEVQTNLESHFQVLLGIYNKCEPENSQQLFPLKKVFIHENYTKHWPYYDISLIMLKGDTTKFTPICLPRNVVKQRPREGMVPGLGTLSYHGATPCTLHEARLLIYPDEQCKTMLNNTGNDPKLLNKAFCGGYLQGGTDACQGDSGGPLQVLDKNGNYVLLGVVSFGFRCANPGLLGVYTDVSQYLKWINEKSGLNLNQVVKRDNNTLPTASTVNDDRQKEIVIEASSSPIKIIILRNNKLVATTKKILHYTRKPN